MLGKTVIFMADNQEKEGTIKGTTVEKINNENVLFYIINSNGKEYFRMYEQILSVIE